MRMVCPACSAAYDVPDSLLSAGRAVRCARCAHQWIPVEAAPPPPAPAPAPAIQPPPWTDGEVIEEVQLEVPEALTPETPRFTAMDRLALHRANLEPNRLPLQIAWAASILVLLLLIAGFLVFRTEIAHVWPASRRLYDALGLLTPPAKS